MEIVMEVVRHIEKAEKEKGTVYKVVLKGCVTKATLTIEDVNENLLDLYPIEEEFTVTLKNPQTKLG